MLNKLFLIIIISISLFSCKKEEESVVVKGNIINSTTQQGESQVNIYLYGKKINGSAYNANYTLLSKTTSSSTGDYSINIERENIERYKIKLEKTGFFYEEKEFTQSNFNDNTYIYNKTISPASYIIINIRNAAPYDNSDYFKYNIIKGYKDAFEACPKLAFYEGTSVNTKKEGKIIGNQENEIEYRIIKNNEVTTGIKKIFCPINDTVTVEFNY